MSSLKGKKPTRKPVQYRLSSPREGLTILKKLSSLLPAGMMIFILLFLPGCKQCNNNVIPPSEKPAIVVNAPAFNADSAYAFVEKQVSFGPRVPNTAAHVACGNWLETFLRSVADTVYVQTGQVTAYDGTKLNFKNIIASFNPSAKHRVFLCAHWDTRPFADQDPDPARRKVPNDGADDGASGVAVLLETARALKSQPVTLGVDLILFDVEDYGEPEDAGYNQQDSYCLGSQYWSKKPHVPGYNAKYGILLDMVGAKGASFPMEAYSLQVAPWLVRRVWNNAVQLGFSGHFHFKNTGRPVIDDHYYINRNTSIPVIDIIYMDTSLQKTFGRHWHTHDDNLSVIDKNTLKAVGQSLLLTIYQEAAGGI